MNKKNLIQNYGLWILLLLVYSGFIFLKNNAWIEKDNLSSADLLPNLHMEIQESSENPDSPAFIQKSAPSASDTNPARQKNINTHAPVRKPQSESHNQKRTYQPAPIDINEATQKEWETLRGIGNYRSGRIIRFRTALGGFHSIEQVGETYDLPDSVFNSIRPFLRMETSHQTLKINTLSYDSLHLHPYITKQMAYFIVSHRQKHPPFSDVKQLYEIIEEKDHERLKKLEPYVDFSIR